MLAVTINWASPTLTLTSDAASDSVSVVGRASYVDIFVNNNFQARIQTANANNVAEIRFDGGAGTDSLTIQGIQPTGTLAIGSAGNKLSGLENLTVVNGKNVTIHNGADPLNFGTSKFNGTLAVTSAAGLTQTGALSVSGAATFTVTAGSITLNNASNNFNGTVTVTANSAGQDLSLRDVNGIVLGNIDVGGDLTIVANNNSTRRVAISQAAGTTLKVDGNTSLTAGSSSTITLANAGNEFGDAAADAITVTAANATIVDSKAFATTLGASTVTQNLTVTSAHDIFDAGKLVVGKVATFSAASGFDIVLDEADNDFGTVAATATGAGASVTINDINALVLGPINTVELTVSTGGAITQKGAITASGTASFAAGTLNDITLNKSTNNFNVVQIVSADDVNLRDANGVQIAPDGGTSTVSGNLTVTAGGVITNGTGNVLVTAGKTTLKGTVITLDSAANNFNELVVTSGTNVTLVDVDALILGKSKISGTLAVTVGGELSQSGPLAVKSGLTTLTAGANDIVLDDAKNNFATVNVVSANNTTLRDVNAIVFAAASVSGVLAVQANLNTSSRLAISQTGAINVTGSTTLEAGARSTIKLDNALNELHGAGEAVSVESAAQATLRDATALTLGESTLSGNLNVTSGGNVTQVGPLTVGKTATFSVGAGNDITLNDPDNEFGTFAVTAANNVAVADKSAIALGASTINGALDVAAEGSITQSGALTVGGAATFDAGESNDITLLNAANNFTSVGIAAGKNVALRDEDAIDLALSSITGTFDLIADGDITDSGALEIGGKATLRAGASNDILLDEALNNLGEVGITAANDVTLVNADALVLAASTISGTLDVTLAGTASGGLTQNGALTVSGLATFDTPNNDIVLDIAANNFSTVAIVSAVNATLRDINALVLDDLTVDADLAVIAGGAITDGNALSVDGLTTLTTSALADVILDNTTNSFTGDVSVNSAKNVTLNATGGLILGASTISGTLNVTLAGVGDLTQSGAVSVAGLATLDATAANNIDLSLAGNDFATVAVTAANDVTLADANDVDLGAMTVAGNLSVTANGSVTDSGVLNVTGDAAFQADADGNSVGDITLNSVSSFVGRLSVGGGVDVAIYNNIATRLGNLNATGNLTITGNDDLDNGPSGGPYGIVSVVGDVTLDIGINDMSLNQNGWSYGTLTLIFGTLTPLP